MTRVDKAMQWMILTMVCLTAVLSLTQLTFLGLLVTELIVWPLNYVFMPTYVMASLSLLSVLSLVIYSEWRDAHDQHV